MASTNLCVDTQPFCIENGQNLHAPQATTITTVLCIYTNEAKARVTITT